MATQVEEEQAKEFLKRAEIKTMKKDLRGLREVDALKERDKIVKIKTLEEQQAEQAKKMQIKEAARVAEEKEGVEEILQKNEKQEIIAEKDLKEYATEEERQQIFLLESNRFEIGKQIDEIDKKKDPELKLQKNKLLLQKRDQQVKLDAILEEEKKLETEQKFITGKEQTTTITSERRGFEQTRADMEKKIEEVEKKRWAVEKQIEETDKAIGEIDSLSEKNVTEKNELRNRILGVDKSLREIYSVVMAREEEKRRGLAQDQLGRKKTAEELRAKENERVQRRQWSGGGVKDQENKVFLADVPAPARNRIIEAGKMEENQRKKFVQDVEDWAETGSKPSVEEESPTNEIPVPKKKQ